MMEVVCMYCGRVHAVTEKEGMYIIKCDSMDMDKRQKIADKWKTLKERLI